MGYESDQKRGKQTLGRNGLKLNQNKKPWNPKPTRISYIWGVLWRRRRLTLISLSTKFLKSVIQKKQEESRNYPPPRFFAKGRRENKVGSLMLKKPE